MSINFLFERKLKKKVQTGISLNLAIFILELSAYFTRIILRERRKFGVCN